MATIVKYKTVSGFTVVKKFTYLSIQATADGVTVTSSQSATGDLVTLNTGEALSIPVNPATYVDTIINGDALIMTDGQYT